jgi:hypothetical protein
VVDFLWVLKHSNLDFEHNFGLWGILFLFDESADCFNDRRVSARRNLAVIVYLFSDAPSDRTAASSELPESLDGLLDQRVVLCI